MRKTRILPILIHNFQTSTGAPIIKQQNAIEKYNLKKKNRSKRDLNAIYITFYYFFDYSNINFHENA